jgi:nucleoside-diphosphate-sugar epimerase
VRMVAERTATLSRASVWTNRLHREDCAGALAHLASLPSPAARYVGVDSEPAERNAVLAFIAARLDLPFPPLAEAETEAAATRGGANKRCRNARLLSTGYRLRYPSYREGYAELVDDWKRASGSRLR